MIQAFKVQVFQMCHKNQTGNFRQIFWTFFTMCILKIFFFILKTFSRYPLKFTRDPKYIWAFYISNLTKAKLRRRGEKEKVYHQELSSSLKLHLHTSFETQIGKVYT